MSDESDKRIEILMVEDSPTDVLIAKEAISQARLINSIHVVSDGVEAMAFLRKEGRFSSAPRPDLVLLDLNLPRKSGKEVLAEIKSDENLKRLPVVVLTSSREESDVLKAYGLQANCYICKPVDILRSNNHFWFSVDTLPAPG